MWDDDLPCYEIVCNPSIQSISYHPPFRDIDNIDASIPFDLISLPTNQFVVAGRKRRFEYEKRLYQKLRENGKKRTVKCDNKHRQPNIFTPIKQHMRKDHRK
ncbi:hypothetical protein V6N11_073383 [Hibiscus sabdariffa]|uniref:CCT domain-containing protein n=1 Tax=Hibiscus sabdariffa TaxID=183260 RepID=A0ABR2P4F7_9ROSI